MILTTIRLQLYKCTQRGPKYRTKSKEELKNEANYSVECQEKEKIDKNEHNTLNDIRWILVATGHCTGQVARITQK